MMTSNGNSADVKFRIALKTDRERISEFIHRYFYPEEPITVGSTTGYPSEGEVKFTLDSVNFSTSIIAYLVNSYGNEEIIGIVISEHYHANDATAMLEEISKSTSPEEAKWRETMKFWVWIDETADLFHRMNVDKTLHIHTLAIHAAYRSRGLGKVLVKKTIEMGKERDFPAVSVDCSSVFTMKIAESLGMKSYSWVPYTEIKDENGVQLYHPPEPHTFFGTYAVHIN